MIASKGILVPQTAFSCRSHAYNHETAACQPSLRPAHEHPSAEVVVVPSCWDLTQAWLCSSSDGQAIVGLA